jgi:hypothetical protein
MDNQEKSVRTESEPNIILTKPTKNKVNTPNLCLLLVDNNRFRGYRNLNEDKQIARKLLFEKINHLIKITYDNYVHDIPENTPNVIAAYLDKESKSLAGIMILMRESIRGIEFAEFGVSIVAKEYRGYSVQTRCREALTPYMFELIESGMPLRALPRAFSAHSQLQVYNAKFPTDNNEMIRIGQCGGFYLFYFVEKDQNGQFILENDMIFTAWNTMDKIIVKEIYLPARAVEKKFFIFDSNHRSDTHALYCFPGIRCKNEYTLHRLADIYKDLSNFMAVYPENDYSQTHWEELTSKFIIIGHEKDQKKIKNSRSKRFTYSDGDSPNHLNRSIHIESISSFNFLLDLDNTAKVVTICLQISDFENEIEKIANVALIDILIKEGFVPTAQFDALYNKRRVRICYFSKWQKIQIEAKYEILEPYAHMFDILNHDTMVQGLGWPKIVNVLAPEGVNALKSDDAENQEQAYTLDQHFAGIDKGATTYNHFSHYRPVKFHLSHTPFFKSIKDFLKENNLKADVIFATEVNILTYEIIQAFDDIIRQTPYYFERFNLLEQSKVTLTYYLKDNILRIRFEKITDTSC